LLLARLVLLQLFAPAIHRVGLTPIGRHYLVHLQQLVDVNLTLEIAHLEAERHSPPLEHESSHDFIRRITDTEQQLEVAAALRSVVLGRVEFDPRRLVNVDESFEWDPVLAWHQRLTTVDAEPESGAPLVMPTAAVEHFSELIPPSGSPSIADPEASQIFAAFALSSDPSDWSRALAMLDGQPLPPNFAPELLVAVKEQPERAS